MPIQQFVSYIMERENKLIFNEMMMRSALYWTNTLSWIFIVLAHWNNSPRVDMSVNSGHIILIPSQPVFAFSPECCVLSREATNTNFIVFRLTRPVLKLTIYRTRGKHPNHYTTGAVPDR